MNYFSLVDMMLHSLFQSLHEATFREADTVRTMVLPFHPTKVCGLGGVLAAAMREFQNILGWRRGRPIACRKGGPPLHVLVRCNYHGWLVGCGGGGVYDVMVICAHTVATDAIRSRCSMIL